MTILYRIKDWGKTYETSETRKLRTLQWVPLPVKLHGTGYNLLVRKHESGENHFAAWCALLQVAAACKPRGVLRQGNGDPHTPESLSLVTHISEATWTVALERLSSPRIAWIETVANEEVAKIPAESPGIAAESAGTPGKSPGRREGKGREGNDDESKSDASGAAMMMTTEKTDKSRPATESARDILRSEVVSDVACIGQVSGITESCPDHFVDAITNLLVASRVDVPTVERFFQSRVDGIQAGSVSKPRRWPWVEKIVKTAIKRGEFREIAEGLKGGGKCANP